MNERVGVLFVCLGNICRSPVAEAVFLRLVRERGLGDRFDVDSAGTGGWHAGERADPRARAVGAKHGTEVASIARRIDPGRDWARFAHVVVMDDDNRRRVVAEGAPAARVSLLREWEPEGWKHARRATVLGVPDPYQGDDEGFAEVYAIIARCCAGLLDELAAGLPGRGERSAHQRGARG